MANETRHTPGTWKAYLAVADNAPNYWIVSTRAFKGTVTATCDNEANAKLIAAAPDLLAACKARLIASIFALKGPETLTAEDMQLAEAIKKAEAL